MAAKKGKDTLKDLSKFLQEKDSPETESGGISEDFLTAQPNTLVAVSTLSEQFSEQAANPDLDFLHEVLETLARNEGKSVREVLYALIERSLTAQTSVEASDIMLLSTVQYLSHTQKMGAVIEELAKK